MNKGKNILKYSALILTGAILGAGIVWNDYGLKKNSEVSSVPVTSLPQANSSSEREKSAACAAYLKFKETKESLFSSGTPEYGKKLNVSYDQAGKAVDVLAELEGKVGLENLTKKEKERYITIGATKGTACEYCCGIKTFGREDGQRACGCKHNIAFSGLTMWMLKNGYKNEDIFREIVKWKALFFPKQTLSKKLQEMEKAGEPGIKNILKEFPGFLPSMVGGC
jgi:hypothetical protein